MTSLPLIGVNASIQAADVKEREELRAPLCYIDAITGAGGIPLCIPPYKDHRLLREIIPLLNGFLFIGGDDYRPEHYGGHPQPEEELVHPRRDAFDLAVAGIILNETDLPVLGICGGCQLLAIAQGGALIQNIGTEWIPATGDRPLPHSRQARNEIISRQDQNEIIPGPEGADLRGTPASGKRGDGMIAGLPQSDVFRHSVRFAAHSLAARATGTPPGGTLATNSFHHQAVQPDRIGRNLIASAWSADGIIEAIEPAPRSSWAEKGRFILGIQWHPERMQDEDAHHRLFQIFVQETAKVRPSL